MSKVKEPTVKLIPDADSKEYKLGHRIACHHRENMNGLLGKVLTIVESAMGETKQAEATKDLIKHEIWRITDNNQDATYKYVFNPNGDEGIVPMAQPVAMTNKGRME